MHRCVCVSSDTGIVEPRNLLENIIISQYRVESVFEHLPISNKTNTVIYIHINYGQRKFISANKIAALDGKIKGEISYIYIYIAQINTHPWSTHCQL